MTELAFVSQTNDFTAAASSRVITGDATSSGPLPLQPLSDKSGIGKFLARRGEGIHHLCFETDDVDAELAGAKAKGIRVIDEKPRLGLAGMICFLHPAATRGVLVEYAQPFADEEHAR